MSELSSGISLDTPLGLVEPQPEAKRPSASRRAINKLSSVSLKALDVGREMVNTKEKRYTTLALGALSLASSVAQFGGMMKGWPEPFSAMRDSGRHPLVGYAVAVAASQNSRFNSWRGALMAGLVAEVTVEAMQGVIVTGIINNGWGNVGDFVRLKQLKGGNIQDGLFTIGGAIIPIVSEKIRNLHQHTI